MNEKDLLGNPREVFSILSVNFFFVLFRFFASNAESRDRTRFEASRFDRFLAFEANSESPFFDSRQSFVNFQKQKAFPIPKFEDQVLVHFTCGQVGLIRKIIR